MQVQRPPYEMLVLVCTNEKEPGKESCAPRGSREIYQELKARVKAMRPAVRVRVSQTGCLDLCSMGPNVLVYPQGIHYAGVRLEDIDTILEDLFGPGAARGGLA